ncbi:MAG: MBL fold metallo-hydrolase [Candidatus Andersenbacteria bacterium]
MLQITFYGGASGVTGSKHLLAAGEKRILFDCGTFQGLPDMRERNRSLPFPPESIDFVLLSHAHIDHCGMLPLLVKRGFQGKIISTPATQEVAQQMLADAAAIEIQDALYRRRHHQGAPDDREPLFTPEDIAPTIERFVTVPYSRVRNAWHELSDNMRVKFYDAGHILGSAITVLQVDVAGQTRQLAYTGDLGSPGMPLLYDPEVPAENIEAILVESTYGARHHESSAAALARLAEVITRVNERGGKIIVPAFSLGRTQLFVYLLHKLTDEKKIPRLPIYVDSPLAARITDVFERYKEDYDGETWRDFQGEDHTPLAFRNLTYIRSIEESKQLNTTPGPFIVIAASGMMTAGRVVHHLRHTISDPRNAIFITGYQARGTLGRRLLEGAAHVELYGESFVPRAEIHLFNEFSAHADQSQLMEYLAAVPGLQRVVLIHGEPEQADVLRAELTARHPDWQVERPEEGETITL